MSSFVPSLVLSCLLLAACSGGPKPANQPQAVVFDASQIAVIAQGTQSGLHGELNFVARDAQEWNAIWKQHASLQLPPPIAPGVDWSKVMVVGVVRGPRPSAGYAVAFESARQDLDRMVVQFRETQPAPGAPTATVVTRPFCFVTVPRGASEVAFR